MKGPLQSWGDESRFKTRATSNTPTKSGVIGLIAAAQGRRRTDSVEDLISLRMAVRVDQSGSLLSDYQTAQPWMQKPKEAAQLVTRYFLTDAAFVVALESEDKQLLEGMAHALKTPAFPLFMGRRSCPVHPGLVIGVRAGGCEEALRNHEVWHATELHKRQSPRSVSLAVYVDAKPGEPGAVQRQDVPLSFDPQHRQYGWRSVIRSDDVVLDNPLGTALRDSADVFFETVMRA
nr:type I-E CRISPR-associated protein Cas5/CasD [Corynebacterium aquatimens]